MVSPNRRYTCREFLHEVNWKVVSPDSTVGIYIQYIYNKNCGVSFWTCSREISGDRVALFLSDMHFYLSNMCKGQVCIWCILSSIPTVCHRALHTHQHPGNKSTYHLTKQSIIHRGLPLLEYDHFNLSYKYMASKISIGQKKLKSHLFNYTGNTTGYCTSMLFRAAHIID